MAGTTDEATRDARMGKAIVRGIVVATPIAFIGLTISISLIGDVSLARGAAAAFLPGLLMGGFFGGFYGLVRNMD